MLHPICKRYRENLKQPHLFINRYSNHVSKFYMQKNSQSTSEPKLDFDEDYYSVLEVPIDINDRALKKAYYKMVFKYHPDNKKDEATKELCNRQMMVINGAYKVLKDPELRKQYDRKRLLGMKGNSAGVKEKPNSGSTASETNEKTSNVGKSNKNQYSETYRSSQDTQRSRADPFKGFVNKGKVEEDVPVESFDSLFSDLFQDILFNKGANLLNDLNELLDSQDPEGRESNANKDNKYYAYSRQQIETEVNVIKLAMRNLKDHEKDLKSTLSVEESLLMMNSRKSNDFNEDTKTAASRIQKQLEREENVQSLKARLKQVKIQLTQLQKDLDFASAALLRKRYEESNQENKTQTDEPKKEKYNNNYSDNYQSCSKTDSNKYYYEQEQRRKNAAAKKDQTESLINVELEKLKQKLKSNKK